MALFILILSKYRTGTELTAYPVIAYFYKYDKIQKDELLDPCFPCPLIVTETKFSFFNPTVLFPFNSFEHTRNFTYVNDQNNIPGSVQKSLRMHNLSILILSLKIYDVTPPKLNDESWHSK